MGRKDYSKSEAEWVDVMDTLQHAMSIIEKEIAKNLAFLQKEIDTRNTNIAMVALITEQITDVSRGNTAALVGIEQFFLKLVKIAARPKNGKGLPKLINLLDVEQICICVIKMDYDLADSKNKTRSRTRWRGFHRREHPKTSEILVDGTSGTDGANGTNETDEMTEE